MEEERSRSSGHKRHNHNESKQQQTKKLPGKVEPMRKQSQ
jgi:hypothetical protein